MPAQNSTRVRHTGTGLGRGGHTGGLRVGGAVDAADPEAGARWGEELLLRREVGVAGDELVGLHLGDEDAAGPRATPPPSGTGSVPAHGWKWFPKND